MVGCMTNNGGTRTVARNVGHRTMGPNGLIDLATDAYSSDGNSVVRIDPRKFMVTDVSFNRDDSDTNAGVMRGQAVRHESDGSAVTLDFWTDFEGTSNSVPTLGSSLGDLAGTHTLRVDGLEVQHDGLFPTGPMTMDSNGVGNVMVSVDADGRMLYDTTDGGRRTYQPWRGDRGTLLRVVEGPEERARGLLRRMIGERAFRSYILNGFVTYRGDSGKFYQIFPGWKQVRVWDRGEAVEKLCLIFEDGKLPPTDSVIMRLLMLENDEAEFRRLAVKSSFTPPRRAPQADQQAERGRILRLAEQKKSGYNPYQLTINTGSAVTIEVA